MYTSSIFRISLPVVLGTSPSPRSSLLCIAHLWWSPLVYASPFPCLAVWPTASPLPSFHSFYSRPRNTDASQLRLRIPLFPALSPPCPLFILRIRNASNISPHLVRCANKRKSIQREGPAFASCFDYDMRAPWRPTSSHLTRARKACTCTHPIGRQPELHPRPSPGCAGEREGEGRVGRTGSLLLRASRRRRATDALDGSARDSCGGGYVTDQARRSADHM